MKIGYPCLNWSVGCPVNSTFRLQNYTEQLFVEKAINNIMCLNTILKYNVEHNLLNFRISSDLIPFASHPVCKVEWESMLKEAFAMTGNFIKENNLRVSMHPDQFILLNSDKKEVIEASIRELDYHAKLFDAMGLDKTAKIQIHVGGVYGDKEGSIKRFIQTYKKLPENIKSRLVIENDDRLYSLKDCLEISKEVKIPVLFDFFHHECLNNGETIVEAFKLASKTWKKKDGVPLTDYSIQKEGERKGAHATSINEAEFRKFLAEMKGCELDLMLEIKDKEKSALKALAIAKSMKLL
jgi:UV DNA damage endonuclease